MKRLLILALALMVAGGAMAQDNVGFFRMVDGDYSNHIPMEEIIPGTSMDLYITLHNASSFSVGGFEVGMELPAELIISGADIYNGQNFGGSWDNLLVGYQYPQVIQTEIVVLATLHGTILGIPAEPFYVTMHGSNPPSIDGHDGPVYADGVTPEILVPCGYVAGDPEVFLFGGSTPVQDETWSGVKNLFN